MDPAVRPPDVDRFITDFTGRVPGVLHAIVVTSDGVPLAVSDRVQAGQLEQLSAITSGLISLACTAARMSGDDDVTQALITMELAALVIMPIGGGSTLAVLTTAAADLDLVAYEMTMLAEQASSIFTPPARGAA